MLTTRTQIAHHIRKRKPYSVILLLMLVKMAVGCTNPVGNHICHLSKGSANHTVMLNDATVSVSLPRDYSSASVDMVSSMRFYQSDVANAALEPIYISSSDPRSHLSIHVLENSANIEASESLDSIFVICLKERFLFDKDAPQMPLIEMHIGKDGTPYAYVMHVTRYNCSDTLWRNRPDTFTCPMGADSVESSFYYYTLHGQTEYIIHYYSLDSYEQFSFSDNRAVLESIVFHYF